MIQDFDPIIGVSKRCCPVCYHLLSLIAGQDKNFVVQGSHKTVSPCTLPVWLPENIVDSMNIDFGQQLRHELIKRMESAETWRKRTDSTGSGGRGSLDSYRGDSIPGGVKVRSEAEMLATHL